MLVTTVAQTVSLFVAVAYGASTFSPARPPAIPLAVRSPYLSTWLGVGNDGGDGGILPGAWPTFWAGAVTGWTGLIRVDGTSYVWMGEPLTAPSVNQTSFTYTASTSKFVLDVGGSVQMTVTFDSPIFPNDLKRQSLVFSYLNVDVQSLDGGNHDVQLYSDISAEWVSGDRTATVEWDFGVTGSTTSRRVTRKRDTPLHRREAVRRQSNSNSTSTVGPSGTSASSTSSVSTPSSTYPAGGIAYHKVYRQTQLDFSEINDQTEFGYWYWATDNVANLTYQSGEDSAVREGFATYGFLNDTQDTDFRAIDDSWPVFGFAIDLGSVDDQTVSTLFSIGLTQEYPIQFDSAQGNVSEPALWTSYFSDELSALSFFHSDYSHASSAENSFDSKLQTDATSAGGSDYYAITALASRQAFGATQLCGTSSKPYLFLKEISSDGNVNTVDVIFPMHLILLYSNPTLLKYLLDPLYENQESGQYPNTYAMHDLGSSYPNATGHAAGNDEMMPVEECGNMIIMTLAYAQRSGDTAYLNQHYDKLQQWTAYLVNDSLIPSSQISTDDFAGALANQTNLALKGILGIGAMSSISNLTGNHSAEAQNYSSTAQSYFDQWEDLGIAKNAIPPHTTLNYGNDSSYSLLYNLLAAPLLSLSSPQIPQSLYTMQSSFYPTVFQTYGVPLDTRHTYTKLDWELFCAAIAEEDTRQKFFGTVVKWINETVTSGALTDLYDVETGE
ncbi:putative glutaminase [Phaeomoniella chlamydospora]|uniref:Putative glutaminase n=1 Tax=Phaeomoniella chlamydospora TaxID=158046 RepID=A0A0G2ENP9_PHACM|nr:putative glutaminase [Phaeomoniella chlamydospora]